MNLKELSIHLGLSPTTVSRALNGYPEVGAETRKRVLLAAKELGYRPSPTARNLATGRSMSLGVDLGNDFQSPQLMAVQLSLLKSLATLALEREWWLVILPSLDRDGCAASSQQLPRVDYIVEFSYSGNTRRSATESNLLIDLFGRGGTMTCPRLSVDWSGAIKAIVQQQVDRCCKNVILIDDQIDALSHVDHLFGLVSSSVASLASSEISISRLNLPLGSTPQILDQLSQSNGSYSAVFCANIGMTNYIYDIFYKKQRFDVEIYVLDYVFEENCISNLKFKILSIDISTMSDSIIRSIDEMENFKGEFLSIVRPKLRAFSD